MGFDQANDAVKLLAQKEGVAVGVPSGATLMGAILLLCEKKTQIKISLQFSPMALKDILHLDIKCKI